jgi:hypothetical protein
MSRGTAFCFSQLYLKMLMAGPVLAHEFGNVSPGRLSDRLHQLGVSLPSNWHIYSRWVTVPSKLGFRIKEKLYRLERL